MKMQLRGTAWRASAALAITALLTALSAMGGVAAHAEATPQLEQHAVADEHAATSGSLSWGVRTSIRNYLEQHGHTEGWVSAYDGAAYTRGGSAADFPLRSGSVDPVAGTAQLQFDGALEMAGFGESWLYFEDLRVSVSAGTATLTVDMIESYNVKERTDDLVLATFEVPSGGLTITENELSFTTPRGAFSEDVALDHLPSYGGPTYAAPNDYTDPMTLRVGFGDNTSTPEPSPPATGPYGVSTGAAYSDSTATVRVTPGYALAADGATTLTVEGFGFDAGSAGTPYNIYVGLGTMKDHTNPEKWRRSQGGSSGPVGQGDFTYGTTSLVVSSHSADAEVADAVIDANGSWKFTMTVPGKDVPSFFGGTIDCVTNACGVFTFGAHGAIRAANEAYTPVFFDGQDAATWPDRDDDGGDDDDPVVVPPIEKPTPTDPNEPAPTPPGSDKTCVPNGTNSTTNAAGAVLTVAPATCLGDADQTVKVSGSGYPTSRDGNTFGGVYVLFGWVDRDNAAWGPAAGGTSGTSYTYAQDGQPAGTFQKMVNFPGNTTGEGMPTMDATGSWEIDLPIEASRFVSAQGKTVDCYEVTCGVITVGAHGATLAGGEAFTPVYFTGSEAETGNKTPETESGTGSTPNPNAQNPAGSGAAAGGTGGTGGALAVSGAESSRSLFFGGLLLVSGGLLAFVIVRFRRVRREALTIA